MNTIPRPILLVFGVRLSLLALAAALLAAACGSSSTSLVAPTVQKCQISVNGFTGAFGPSGGSGSATIDAARECSWSAATQASWISLASPAQGTGTGTLSFTVLANPAPRARSGALNVNSQQLTISQEPAPCRFSVSPSTLNAPAAGGTAALSVSATDASCAWTASSQSPWISIASPTNVSGSATVSLGFAPNAGTARNGTVVAAGQSIAVEQEAATPSPVPGPPSPVPGPPSPNPSPTPTPTPTTTIQLVGDVSARKGGCPVLSFFVQGIAVVTTADTVFINTPCNKIKNGLRVTVDGVQQAGQPVVATRVTSSD